MSTISFKRFFRSFHYARLGLAHAFQSEHSFRIHTVAVAVVTLLMLVLRVSARDAALLILVMSVILVLEITNTVIERLVGILEPRIHPYIGTIKDLMAGAVLITSIGGILIGFFILGPYLGW